MIITETPLRRLRHQKGWRLIRVKQELIKQGTPISWPTLLKIDHGYKSAIIRDKQGKIIEEKKMPYTPHPRTLADLAKLFKVKIGKVYQHKNKK